MVESLWTPITYIFGLIRCQIPCRRQHRWPSTTGWRQSPWTLTHVGVHLLGCLHAVGGLILERQQRLPGLRNYPEIPAHLHHSLGHATHEQSAEDYGALLLWPAEGGEVEVPPSPATRGHCTDVITATPWAQSTQSTGGSTWSTGDPFIANKSPEASASIREIR
ncbi:hypothetical protein Taro_023715 [Colocasia esculenta]|uniref:Uncharacterized protein n=1 Tax=Colocasia esculenta TaxID=4460 RepID=A0A843VBL5_COLES|nr:hypothetical protein [Colocasia esculenta]